MLTNKEFTKMPNGDLRGNKIANSKNYGKLAFSKAPLDYQNNVRQAAAEKHKPAIDFLKKIKNIP